MVRLAVFPPSRENPERPYFNGIEYGHVSKLSDSGYALRSALHLTRSWEVFQFLRGGLGSSYRDDRPMAQSAERGDLRLVEKFLDHGWPSQGEKYYALSVATRHCHLDVVDLLLSRGANPNYYRFLTVGSPLANAAKVGSISIVRKLYEYGANNDNTPLDQEIMLLYALQAEHTEMVNLFFERGVLNRVCPSQIRKQIKDAGLKSMEELLKRWGE